MKNYKNITRISSELKNYEIHPYNFIQIYEIHEKLFITHSQNFPPLLDWFLMKNCHENIFRNKNYPLRSDLSFQNFFRDDQTEFVFSLGLDFHLTYLSQDFEYLSEKSCIFLFTIFIMVLVASRGLLCCGRWRVAGVWMRNKSLQVHSTNRECCFGTPVSGRTAAIPNLLCPVSPITLIIINVDKPR